MWQSRSGQAPMTAVPVRVAVELLDGRRVMVEAVQMMGTPVGLPLSRWQLTLHGVYAGLHIYFIFTVVLMSFVSGPPEDFREDAKSIHWSKVVMTYSVAPFVIYQTGKHWWQGTYFPMTSSDSCYALRFGREVDRNPPYIRCGTLFCMLWLSLFFCILSLLSFLELNANYCPLSSDGDCHDSYSDLTSFRQWIVLLQWWSSLACLILRLKTFVLAYVFLIIVSTVLSALGVVTFGLLPILMVVACVRCWSIDRETNLHGCPCWLPYDIVAFFYRNL